MVDEEKELSANQTMTKIELISYLLEREDIEMNSPILVEYEGQYKPILKGNVSPENIGCSVSLVIGVEYT